MNYRANDITFDRTSKVNQRALYEDLDRKMR